MSLSGIVLLYPISFIFSLEKPVRGDDLIKARPMVRTVEERAEFL